MSKKTMLVPSYMKNFNCIGKDCTDSCCGLWNINIDKKSYQHYKKCKDKDFKLRLENGIKRNRKNSCDENYAKIVLDKDTNRCPFLNENKLCDIYINMGQEYMCDTCTIYPRVYSEVNGVIEKSLSVSCPEATRLVLDNEEKMSFEEVSCDDSRYISQISINTNKEKFTYYIEKYFWDLRVIAIDIIQNRDYSIDERIIILGMLCDEVNNFIKEGKGNEIKSVIEKYEKRLLKGEYKEILKDIPFNIGLKIKLILEIQDIKFSKGVNKNYFDIVNKTLKMLYNEDEIEEKYFKAKDNYDKSLENKYSYMMENYLVNHLFKNTFPLRDRKDIFEEYILLCIYYSIIKFNLIGLSLEKELKKEEILEFIQQFSKSIEHDPDYINKVYMELKNVNFNQLKYMILLIKN